MPQSRLLRGTFILSAATFFTKFIGLIFIIPFAALVGPKGLALYGYAYVPYTIILSMATAGVPMAVSKFVSKYNTLGDYETGRRLFRSGMFLMTLSGFAAFLVLFFLAPVLAPLVLDPDSITKQSNSTDDVVTVIRLVSLALIAVPPMSLMRGYFQGFQSMGPTAVSQVVEQIVRIGFILIGAALVLYVFNGTVTTAVGMATLAAFVGALGGFAVLIWYWRKRKRHLDRQIAQGRTNSNLPLKSMYKELVTYAVPFTIVGLAIPLYQLVDQLTVNHTLTSVGYKLGEAEDVFANLNQYTQKLIMIPVSLATALSVTLVPTITHSFISGKFGRMHHQMTQAFQIVLFLTIPAAVGLSVLAYSVYGALYWSDHVHLLHLGGQILRWYAPTALLFAIFSTSAAILQGINQQKFAIFSLLVGLLLKMVFNPWLLTVFHGIGAILATDIGYICSIIVNLLVIRAYAGYRLKFIMKRGLLILIFSAIMAVAVWLVTWPFQHGDAVPKSHFGALITMVIGVIAGVGCYFWLAYRSNLAGQIFGNRFSFLKRRKGESR
jgi:O-antigen/teichoic acid export membrane protein